MLKEEGLDSLPNRAAIELSRQGRLLQPAALVLEQVAGSKSAPSASLSRDIESEPGPESVRTANMQGKKCHSYQRMHIYASICFIQAGV